MEYNLSLCSFHVTSAVVVNKREKYHHQTQTIEKHLSNGCHGNTVHPSIHHIFNEKLTKRNNVQYEGKNKFKKISLCTLIHVFEQLSSNEVSGVRLNSQRTVVTARSQFI